MKKILFILSIICIFAACSSDDNTDQDYTSFVIVTNEDVNLINSVAGYYTKDGYCKKIGNLGDLTKGKYSNEIKIDIDTLNFIYLFSDYPFKSTKSDTVFKLKKNQKNIFELGKYTKGIGVDPNDNKQYPH